MDLRTATRALGLAGAGAGALWLARTLRQVPDVFGADSPTARLTAEEQARLAASPQFAGGRFHNDAPTRSVPGVSGNLLRRLVSGAGERRPHGPVPLDRPSAAELAAGVDGVAVTWFGHASTLVRLAGRSVLLDPVWAQRCSPTPEVGPRRLHPVPVPLADLPEVDAVVISHDHYDHLDMGTVRELARRTAARFVVPLGVGAHLRRWGVPADRVDELDWGGSVDLDGLRLTATAAQHFSGRLPGRDATLWASWVIAAGGRSVFYTGDTGFFDGFADTGAAHGPFDVSLVQVGAYDPAWPDIHMTPREALAAHLAVRARLLVPVHWCTFNLAFHPWAEPVEQLVELAHQAGSALVVPRPGQTVDVDDPPPLDPWWRALV